LIDVITLLLKSFDRATSRRLDDSTTTDLPERLAGVGADWDRLFEVSVHPTQVEILSAMEWVAVPISPVVMTVVLGKGRQAVGHVGYHMRKLSEHGLLELDSTRPVRGAVEHFYLLTEA
jgi:hypothetical protein